MASSPVAKLQIVNVLDSHIALIPTHKCIILIMSNLVFTWQVPFLPFSLPTFMAER